MEALYNINSDSNLHYAQFINSSSRGNYGFLDHDNDEEMIMIIKIFSSKQKRYSKKKRHNEHTQCQLRLSFADSLSYSLYSQLISSLMIKIFHSQKSASYLNNVLLRYYPGGDINQPVRDMPFSRVSFFSINS